MSRQWIDAVEAGRILDVPPRSAMRLADEGLIGVRNLPRVKARFRRADVEALARNSLVPARTSSLEAVPS